MIKPSEFRPYNDDAPPTLLAALEEMVDTCLAQGQLIVPRARTGASKASIELVAQRYRDAGWIVRTDRQDAEFVFELPSQ